MASTSKKIPQRVRIIGATKGAWYEEVVGNEFNVLVDWVNYPGLFLAQFSPFWEMGQPFDMLFPINPAHCIVVR